MDKTGIVMEAAKRLDLSGNKANVLVNTVFEVMGSAMSKGEAVKISGFGTFNLVESKARKGRNPRTGEAVDIPAKIAIRFRPGKQLKEMVN